MTRRAMWTVCGLAVALALAGGVSHFASSSPDGLERVAEDNGFMSKGAETGVWQWPLFADYGMTPVATSAAGLIGTMAVFLAGYGLSKCLGNKK